MKEGTRPRLGILASATARPEAEFRKLQAWFAELELELEPLVLLEVSSQVPGWEQGARDPAQVGLVEELAGLWVPGGDQNQTLALLREPEGADTPLLAAIRRRAALPAAGGGLVLGGTSAGAAVMSDPMIGGGTSFGALALSRAAAAGRAEMSPALWVSPGLGLFDEGMIDQHFDSRARLGRLVEAALVEDGARRLAFGIDEATALVREGRTGRLSVVGAGGVTIVDVREARRDFVPLRGGPRLRVRGVHLSYLTEGDSFDPVSETIDFGRKEAIAPGDGSFASPRPEASGIFSPYGCFASFAARMLLDNDPGLLFREEGTGRGYARSLMVEDLAVPGRSAQPLAWEIRLLRGSEGREASLHYDGHYSFTGIDLDILPIEVQITRSA